MNRDQTTIIKRREAVADALASVRAEGLEPTASLIHRLDLYVQGKISAQQLQSDTFNEVKNKALAAKG